MITYHYRMLYRHIALALLVVASLHAQQPTETQLNKLYSQIDDALGLHPGVNVADIGTGFAIDHALRMAERPHRVERSFALM